MIKVPEKFQKDLKEVRLISEQVCEHHDHLEGMMLMSILADIGNRAMFFVGVPDTGKSRCAEVIRQSTERSVIMPHGLTVNGLNYYAKSPKDSPKPPVLGDGASLTIIVEDLSRSGTLYVQFQTVSLLCGLAYTGSIVKHTHGFDMDIGVHSRVNISALIYGQPLILKKIVGESEFDSDIRDKCPRYYHLFRPTDPYPKPLQVKTKYKTLDRQPVQGQTLDDDIIMNFRHSVSKGRAIEHCDALVSACARLNGRDEVTDADKWLVRGLTNNFRIESTLFRKKDLEGPRAMDINMIPVLTAWMSFKQTELTVKFLGLEFGVSERRTREILQNMDDYVLVNSNHVYPTKESKFIMKEIQFDGDVP